MTATLIVSALAYVACVGGYWWGGRRRVRRAADTAARLRAMAAHPAGKLQGDRLVAVRRGFVVRALEGEAFACPFCREPVDLLGDPTWQVDHRTPQAYGGGHEPANLRPSHAACNGRAGQRLSTRKAVRPW